jgi:hypothetical protein
VRGNERGKDGRYKKERNGIQGERERELIFRGTKVRVRVIKR